MDIRRLFGSGTANNPPVPKKAALSPAKTKEPQVVDLDSEIDDDTVFESKPASSKKSPTKRVTNTSAKIPSPVKESSPTKNHMLRNQTSPVVEKTGKQKKIRVVEPEEEDMPERPHAKVQKSPQKAAVSTLPERVRASAPSAAKSEQQLWADKYAPKEFDDLVGAQSIVKGLTKWLKEWDDVHLLKRIKIPYDKSNPGAKAALLSGPPGIGKSTTARLVAQACGRDVFELNASDTRSKKLLEEELSDVVQASVLTFGGKRQVKRRVVVMDEVDGMSASDRGGIQELIKIIKSTRTPIICICNDYSKPAVRSLANHCFDLKFQRPQLPSILKRIKDIAKQERVTIEDETLEGIIKSSGNDVRQVLNALQMWSATKSSAGLNPKERIGEINKDAVLRLSPFDAARFIFCESRKSSLAARNEAFLSDYDLIPLMVAQNYVTAIQASQTSRDESAKMARLARAADAVCDADVIAKYVRSDQRWDLLTSQAMLNIRVAHLCDGSIGFPGFPEWLGKNSNAQKRSRLLGELTSHVRASKSATSLDRNSLRLDYVPAMRSVFVVPLATQGAETVDKVIEYLDDYSMSRDDLFESLSELQFPESLDFKDYFKLIQSNAKAAFTREYNKRAHKSQVLGQGEVSKKGRRKAIPDDGEGIEDEDGAVDDEVYEEDAVDLEAFKPKSKKRGVSSSNSAPSTKKAKGK